MKKSLIIVIAVVLVLLLAGLFFVKSLNNKQDESMPDIEQVGNVQENVINTEEKAPANASEPKSVELPAANTPEENVIKKVVKKVQEKLSHEKDTVEVKETVNELQAPIKEVKYTPETDEETELLKKVPRSEEVVVDKEIKSKASNKYIFK